MFERPHHRQIARVLEALDGGLLRQCSCFFGGGTAIALLHGEFRESVDVDFLVSDRQGYRHLRTLMAGAAGFGALLKGTAAGLEQARDVRIDQYGIRTVLLLDGTPIKFEIVHEGRIELELPGTGDAVLGISTLTGADLVASKLLANSDRWRDDSVFSRDVIDLAMMSPTLPMFRRALAKSAAAYGDAVINDLGRALEALAQRPGRLQQCMDALAITLPSALLQQRLRVLRRRVERQKGREGDGGD
ncbi:MAG: nucleotidyl transferase AbiEii/AbiGii toxin family protein [Xanthomonadales bacterium]|nr:nucleotidyl transferase AbiEii/AbiGii toxin family protein [Xanthomonadales bacterium]